jgi:hypothetical protein
MEAAMDLEADAPPPAPAARPAPMGDAQRELDKKNDQDLKDWILSLRTGPSLKIILKRLWPKKADDGTPVVGKCDEYDEPVTEDDIAERHGGGKYEIILQKPGAKGGWTFFKQATIEIPGKPNFAPVLGYTAPTARNGGEPAPVVDRVLAASERQIEDARRAQKAAEERAERLLTERGTTGFDVEALKALQAPLLEELRSSRKKEEALEGRITALLQHKPDTSAHDRLYEKMIDGGAQQLQTLRTQHDSELRQVRENNLADIRRIEDRHEKAMDRLIDSHKREISGLERAHAQELKATETALNGRIDQLKSDMGRLERELTAKDQELARLRALKEKSPMEALEDAVKIKEHLVDLGMAADPNDKDEDEDDKMPGWVKGLTVLLDNPVAQGFAERLAGTGAQQQQQAPQQYDVNALAQQLRPGQAAQLPDGSIVMKRPDGQLVMMTAQQAAQARQQRKAALSKKRAEKGAAAGGAAPAGEDASGNPPPLRIAKEDLAKVVRFIEGAITNGTTPEQFAQTAATMAPKPVMQAIKRQTVEWFLEQAEVDDASSINTQAGRDWLRKLSVVLKAPVG